MTSFYFFTTSPNRKGSGHQMKMTGLELESKEDSERTCTNLISDAEKAIGHIHSLIKLCSLCVILTPVLALEFSTLDFETSLENLKPVCSTDSVRSAERKSSI